MAVRRKVAEFVRLGPLPDQTAEPHVIDAHQALLQAIPRPASDEEAALLVTMFGPDDCFGLAWMLLHLIETAPGGAQLSSRPGDDANEWLRRLWDSAHRDGLD